MALVARKLGLALCREENYMTTFQFRDIIHIFFRSMGVVLKTFNIGYFKVRTVRLPTQPNCTEAACLCFAWRASHGCITRSSQMFSNGFWFYT